MASPVELGGDVVTGASALAGLFLVYLGNVGAAFGTFDRAQQASVRRSFQVRAWLAFGGIIFAISAAALALIGKWLGDYSIAGSAVTLLFLTLLWGAGIALVAVLDVR